MSKVISKVSLQNNEVSFEVGGKKFTRKIVEFGTLKTFKFNKDIYFVKKSFDWYASPSAIAMDESLIEIFSIYKQSHGWNKYEQFIDGLVEKYSKFDVNDSSSPSAPDSSKFISIHKGNIAKFKQERYGSNSYSSGQYFHIGVKIGTNFPKAQEAYNEAFIVSNLFSNKSCRYDNSEYPASISTVSGSAFTAVGVG